MTCVKIVCCVKQACAYLRLESKTLCCVLQGIDFIECDLWLQRQPFHALVDLTRSRPFACHNPQLSHFRRKDEPQQMGDVERQRHRDPDLRFVGVRSGYTDSGAGSHQATSSASGDPATGSASRHQATSRARS